MVRFGARSWSFPAQAILWFFDSKCRRTVVTSLLEAATSFKGKSFKIQPCEHFSDRKYESTINHGQYYSVCSEEGLQRVVFRYTTWLSSYSSFFIELKLKEKKCQFLVSCLTHKLMILLQGQHRVQCFPMDCLHLLIIHSFSGSSPFLSKGLNGPHISSRSMTELDCKGMTRMYGLNFCMALVFASLISVLLDRNTHTHTKKKFCCQWKWVWWEQDSPTGKFSIILQLSA